MEEVYFVLGMVTVLVVLGILAIVTVKKKIEQLEEEFQFHERNLHDAAVDLHLRIDNEVRELRAYNDQTLLRIKDEVRELQSIIDKNERDILSLLDSRESGILSLLDSRERDVISQLDSRLDRLTSKINKQQLPKG